MSEGEMGFTIESDTEHSTYLHYSKHSIDFCFFFFSSRQDINWESFMIRTKYMAQRKLETNSAEKKGRKNMNSKKYSRYFCVKILLSMK